jgi:hypothetical protein
MFLMIDSLDSTPFPCPLVRTKFPSRVIHTPGFRYELAFLLTCLLAALLCHCNSTEAVAQWCREHEDLLREVFGARLFLTASGSLYRKLLPRLDVQAI